MRVWGVLMSMLAAASCDRAGSDVDCPPEATVEVIQLGSGDKVTTQRTCDWADRRTVIETDARGRVIGRKSYLDDKLDGLQIVPNIPRPLAREDRLEATFRRGVQHGPSRGFAGDELVSECFYIDGARDGVCRWDTTVARYDRKKRTGVWWFVIEGELAGSWVYGDDILLAFDGRSVPPPPASIEVDGKVVQRTSCPPSELDPGNPCIALFDAYQICELEPADRADCRAGARAFYRHSEGRERWLR